MTQIKRHILLLGVSGIIFGSSIAIRASAYERAWGALSLEDGGATSSVGHSGGGDRSAASDTSGLADLQKSAGAGSSKANLNSGWAKFKDKFTLGYFNFATAKSQEANRGYGAVSTYNYFSFEYKISADERIFYRPAFDIGFSGIDSSGNSIRSSLLWDDGYLGFASNKIAWLPFEMDYKTEIRLYLPTSDFSQSTGNITRVRGDMKAISQISPASSFMIWFKPDYYFQSQTGYLSSKGVPTGNRQYGYELSLNHYYNATDKYGIGTAIGHNQYWQYAIPVEKVEAAQTEDLTLETFVGMNFGTLMTHMGVSQLRSLARPVGTFALLKDTETLYFARTFLKF